MSNFLLYEDENIKIEIDKKFHDFLLKYTIEWIELNNWQIRTIVEKIYNYLKYRGIRLRANCLVRKSPILKFNQFIEAQPPFDIFNPIFFAIASYPNLTETMELTREIIEEIESFSSDEVQYYCDIFYEKIYGIQGYVLARQKTGDTLLLFGYENVEQEDDTNEDF